MSLMGGKLNPGTSEQDTEQRVADAAKAAKTAQEDADDLKEQAGRADDATERDKLLGKSELREEEARSHSKEARQIASSAWQGAAGGAGVGASAGAVVGTLTGTIAAVPLAGLGAVVGLPVGLIHGPFFGGRGGKEDKEEPPSEDEQHRAVIQAFEAAQGDGKQADGSEGGQEGAGEKSQKPTSE